MESDFSGLLGLMGNNVGIFEQVPAGLAHYEPLVTTMEAEVENYAKVASLPDFRLFTWFFVIPGVLLVGTATDPGTRTTTTIVPSATPSRRTL